MAKKKHKKPRFFLLEYMIGDEVREIPANGDVILSSNLFRNSMAEKKALEANHGEMNLFEVPLPTLKELKPSLIENNEMYRQLSHSVYVKNEIGMLIPKQRVLFFTGLEQKGFLSKLRDNGLFQYDHSELERIARRDYIVETPKGKTPVDFSKEETKSAQGIIYTLLQGFTEEEKHDIITEQTVGKWLIGDSTQGTLVSRHLEYYPFFAETIHEGFAEFIPKGPEVNYYTNYRALRRINHSLGRRIEHADLLMKVFESLQTQEQRKHESINLPAPMRNSPSSSFERPEILLPNDLIPYYATLMQIFDKKKRKFYVQGKLISKKEIKRKEYEDAVRRYADNKKPNDPYLLMSKRGEDKHPLCPNMNYLSPQQIQHHLDTLNDLFLSAMMKYFHKDFKERNVPTKIIDDVRAVVFSDELPNNKFFKMIKDLVEKQKDDNDPYAVWDASILSYAHNARIAIENGKMDSNLSLPNGTIRYLIDIYKNVACSIPRGYWKSKEDGMKIRDTILTKYKNLRSEIMRDMSATVRIKKKLSELEKILRSPNPKIKEELVEHKKYLEGLIREGKTHYPKHTTEEINTKEMKRLYDLNRMCAREEINACKNLKKTTGIDLMGDDANPRLLIYYMVAEQSAGFFTDNDLYETLINKEKAMDYTHGLLVAKKRLATAKQIETVLNSYGISKMMQVIHNHNFLHEGIDHRINQSQQPDNPELMQFDTGLPAGEIIPTEYIQVFGDFIGS